MWYKASNQHIRKQGQIPITLLMPCWENGLFSADPTKGVGSAVLPCKVASDRFGPSPRCDDKSHLLVSEQKTLWDTSVIWPFHATQSSSLSFHLTEIHSFLFRSFYNILIMPIFFNLTICFFEKIWLSLEIAFFQGQNPVNFVLSWSDWKYVQCILNTWCITK